MSQFLKCRAVLQQISVGLVEVKVVNTSTYNLVEIIMIAKEGFSIYRYQETEIKIPEELAKQLGLKTVKNTMLFAG